jgi:N-acetylglucosaminyl-diphospho-decaprenol L-rhamnosyltransferase
VRPFSVVLVTWNSEGDLAGCVGALAAARARLARPEDVELLVVDNASEDFREEDVRASWKEARIERLDRNLGFGPAANRAASAARGEILLFVNPDTRACGDPFSAIAAAFDADPARVAVAPRLLPAPEPGAASESQEEFQLRRFPTLASSARELLLLDRAFPLSRPRRRERYLDRDRGEAFEVEQPAAAALAVRRDVFARVGGFDETFVPAWWEDVDLCRRLAAEGKILYEPAARFSHAGGRAMRTLGYARFLPIYHRNAIRYWRKHEGRTRAAAYRLLAACGFLLRLALLPWRRSDPRPKRESARAYLGALSVSLRGR